MSFLQLVKWVWLCGNNEADWLMEQFVISCSNTISTLTIVERKVQYWVIILLRRCICSWAQRKESLINWEVRLLLWKWGLSTDLSVSGSFHSLILNECHVIILSTKMSHETDGLRKINSKWFLLYSIEEEMHCTLTGSGGSNIDFKHHCVSRFECIESVVRPGVLIQTLIDTVI